LFAGEVTGGRCGDRGEPLGNLPFVQLGELSNRLDGEYELRDGGVFARLEAAHLHSQPAIWLDHAAQLFAGWSRTGGPPIVDVSAGAAGLARHTTTDIMLRSLVPPSDEKPLEWVAGSRKEFLALPLPVRKKFGLALGFAQRGSRHDSAKVLKGFERGIETPLPVVRLIHQRLKAAEKMAQELRDAQAANHHR
jgi:hypothetical protein